VRPERGDAFPRASTQRTFRIARARGCAMPRRPFYRLFSGRAVRTTSGSCLTLRTTSGSCLAVRTTLANCRAVAGIPTGFRPIAQRTPAKCSLNMRLGGNPNGILSHSPGLRQRRYPGDGGYPQYPTPTGLRHSHTNRSSRKEGSLLVPKLHLPVHLEYQVLSTSPTKLELPSRWVPKSELGNQL